MKERVKKMIETKSRQTTRKKNRFLKDYNENNGYISATCRIITIQLSSYYRWLKEDEYFRAIIDEYNKDIELMK